MTVITLTTDFGTRDEYVGVMKGVILSICPSAQIVDLCHHIRPFDISGAARMLTSSWKYFPRGTIHVAVVDPGVGGKRALIAMEARSHIFIAPDTGILPSVLGSESPSQMVRIENRDLFLKPVSHTFHGRDIFAPCAAHLAKGLPLSSLGPAVKREALARLERIEPFFTPNGHMEGTIADVDHFGNLITDIPVEALGPDKGARHDSEMEICIENHQIKGVSRSYENVKPGTPIALIGSRGYLEIAVNRGNASKFFHIERGGRIRVRKKPTRSKSVSPSQKG